MATKRKKSAGGGIRRVNAPVKNLVEAITETVLERIMSQLPTREEIRDLERMVRELSRKVDALSKRKGARKVGRPRSNRKCEVAGCDLPHVAQGYCSRHYQAWRRKNQGKKAKVTRKKAGARKKGTRKRARK
jgi:hypothetical protein